MDGFLKQAKSPVARIEQRTANELASNKTADANAPACRMGIPQVRTTSSAFEPALHALRPMSPAPAIQTPVSTSTPANTEPGIQRPLLVPNSAAIPSKAATKPIEPACEQDDRRDEDQTRNRAMGYVVSCDGARAIIHATSDHITDTEHTQWAIGRLISINMGKSRIVGLIYQLESAGQSWNAKGENTIIVRAELQGEVHDFDDPANPKFRKGISNYPHVGAIAHRIRVGDLKCIYENTGEKCANIGALSQDETVSAMISVEDMISKHFAILGSTGCGKSSAASLILHRIQEQMPEVRILILDPHNEYSRGFRNEAATIDIDNLELPHWMFQLAEFAEVLFRGDPPSAAELDALRELIPAAKARYSSNLESVSLRRVSRSTAATADTPVPYRISDLLRGIEEQMGLLESPMDRTVLKSLKARIESIIVDPKFRFMFSSRMVTDNALETLGRIFRIPADGKPVSILNMAEIPADVVSSLVSVLCRLAFDLTVASEGVLKVLIVCEEAHRYIPEDKTLGFAPTRNAIARIAKEGRKYGTYICIISQRPGELDPTILSQCSTVFSMRLSNDTDQDIVRKAISESSASTVSFLSSIGNREAIAFGEGLSTPMRLRFSDLPDEWLPGHENKGALGNPEEDAEMQMSGVLARWRRIAQR